MTFALSGFMLYTMWAILILIGADILVSIYNQLRGGSFTFESLSEFLNGILYYVFPLFILVNVMPLDPTGWLVQIAYYVGAAGVIVKYLLQIQRKL